MSQATTRLSLADARSHAEEFRAQFPEGAFARWEFAGSLRRESPAGCGDIEHVVIPSFGAAVETGHLVPRGGVNLMHHALDELADAGAIERQTKSDGRKRWGPKYRACVFNGVVHEVFLADADNWGSILAIRTGPGDLGRLLMIRLRRRGYTHADGRIVRVGQAFIKHATLHRTPDERSFFALCGMPEIHPTQREAAASRLGTDIDHDKWDDLTVPAQDSGLSTQDS